MKNNQLRIGRTNKPAPLQKNPDKQKVSAPIRYLNPETTTNSK